MKYIQDAISEPLSQAKGTAARIDAMTGHTGPHSVTFPIDALSQQIDNLPTALSHALEVPKATESAVTAAWKAAAAKTGYRAPGRTDEIQALARNLQDQLDAINQALGTEQVKSNIIVPAVTPFAS